MQFGSVAFVLAEAILRKLSAKVTHHPVARYLGDHAGGSDAQTDAVAVDDGGLRKRKWNDRQSIDQNVIGRLDQRRDREAHRSMARAQNVDAIDLHGIDMPTVHLTSGLEISSDRFPRAVPAQAVWNRSGDGDEIFQEELLPRPQPDQPDAPRPASSIPAIRATPVARSFFS